MGIQILYVEGDTSMASEMEKYLGLAQEGTNTTLMCGDQKDYKSPAQWTLSIV